MSQDIYSQEQARIISMLEKGEAPKEVATTLAFEMLKKEYGYSGLEYCFFEEEHGKLNLERIDLEDHDFLTAIESTAEEFADQIEECLGLDSN